jgi:hypothetical protein
MRTSRGTVEILPLFENGYFDCFEYFLFEFYRMSLWRIAMLINRLDQWQQNLWFPARLMHDDEIVDSCVIQKNVCQCLPMTVGDNWSDVCYLGCEHMQLRELAKQPFTQGCFACVFS